MKYRIIVKDEASRAEKRRRIIKWIVLTFIVLFLYVIMRTGVFVIWQPVFIIPLTIAVSMHENELPSCIFALFSGYMIDIAFNFIFGFSVVWLMASCLMASLLVKNLIRVNLFNFMIINALATMIEFFMYYLFNVIIWNTSGGEIILTDSILPTVVSTILTSPIMYYLIGFIEKRFSTGDKIYYDDKLNGKEQGENN